MTGFCISGSLNDSKHSKIAASLAPEEVALFFDLEDLEDLNMTRQTLESGAS